MGVKMAFPGPSIDGTPEGIQAGMSLRDYFAAKAMHGAISNPDCIRNFDEFAKGDIPEVVRLISQWAYLCADAMLEARK